MRAATAVTLTSAAGLFLAAGSTGAQHATAYDVEDGARAYETACANCHGPDGNQIAGIDFGRGQFRSPLSDEDLVGIIRNGIPNKPMPATGMSEEQALRIVAYLRSMAAAGPSVAAGADADHGRELFEGKGQCLDCHRVDGRGSRVGPDLSRIGALRKAAELEESLLDPAAEVQPANRFYSVITDEGERVEGRLLNRDTFTVQLMDWDGRLRSFEKTELVSYGFEPTPMSSYRDTLDAEEIADLVAYMVSLRGPSKP
jgi:putative heme-binding domain-containing protein